MKKVINSLTKKDGNKLGKRKKERKWLELEFKSKINPLDIKAFAKDIIESTGERKERLILPSFAGTISEILSMDHGIKAGDFASIGVAAVGACGDGHWRSGIRTQKLISAMKQDIPIITTHLEVDHEEVISKVLDTIKNQESPTVFKPYVHQDESEFYKQIKKLYTTNDDLNNDDHHTVWCGPIIDHDRLNIGSSRNNYEVQNEIFLRARNVGISINLTTPIIKVDAIK